MGENDNKIKELKEYLSKTKKSSSLDRLSKKIEILIDYYSGVTNKKNADKHNISVRTIQRLVKNYEANGQCYIGDDYKGRIPKIDNNAILRIENDLMINPLKLGLNYSIWNGTLLKRYIEEFYGIKVSKAYCEDMLKRSNTIYKSNEYDSDKNKELKNIINNLINEYENKENYRVWYFDTYYLGRNILKELLEEKIDEIDAMLRGNDKYQYMKYIIYGFYPAEKNDGMEYCIKNDISKKSFSELINEFVSNKKHEYEDSFNLLIILDSNNIFKTIIDEELIYKEKKVKILYLPKNLTYLNKINILWDKIKKNSFNIKGKSHTEIEKEFEEYIENIYWH